MAAAALVGAFASAYLLDVYLTGAPIVCGLGPNQGCDIVRASQWSYVFGIIPRPLLGLAFYAGFFLLLAVRTATNRYGNHLRQLTLVLAVFGAFESLYLLGLQAFAIKAYCLWCLTSSVTAFVIAAMAFYDKHEEVRSMTAYREMRIYLLMFLGYAPVAMVLFLLLTQWK